MSRSPIGVAFALALLLAGAGSCSLINAFDDVVETGAGGSGASGTGASGTGGSTGGGGAGAAGGATGGGGAGPTYECGPSGLPFQILSPADLGAGDFNEDLIVVTGNDRTHVIVRNGGINRITARSLRDDDLGPVVTFPAAGGTGRTFDSAVVVGNNVLVPMELAGDPHVLQYTLMNGEIVGTPAPTVVALPDLGPNNCNVGDMFVVRDEQGNPHLAVGCDGGGQRWAWGVSYDVNNQTGSIDWQLNGAESDTTLELRQYAYVAGVHVLLVGSDNPIDPQYTLGLRMGPNAAALGNSIPIQIEPGEATLPLALLPNVDQDGIVVFALSFPASFANSGMWTGNVPIGQFADLGSDPQGILAEEFVWPAQGDIAVLVGASHGPQDIVSAGTTMFDPNASRVELFNWSPDGALRVSSVVVDEIGNPGVAGRHLSARAVPGNALSTLVVWVQEQPAGGSAIVRGRPMQCSATSN